MLTINSNNYHIHLVSIKEMHDTLVVAMNKLRLMRCTKIVCIARYCMHKLQDAVLCVGIYFTIFFNLLDKSP